jgi:Zn finger protein HypA/HybF involved in hydrogenase expression
MKNLTTKEWITKARSVHGNKFDYSKIDYIKSRIKVEIVCKNHGSFIQEANTHLGGHGCPICSSNTIPTTMEWISRAKEVHGDKYNYDGVVYKRSNKKIEIICKKHGMFSQRPNDHLNGSGCPKCGIHKRAKSHTLTSEEFLRQCKEVHGDLYDYSKVNYVNNQTKVEIICKKHGSFYQSVGSHITQRSGCPMCNASKGEILTEKYLNDNGIIYIRQMTFDGCKGVRGWKLKFDFYLPHYNILIEIDGAQHFKVGKIGNHYMTQNDFERIKQNDDIKNRYAFDKKIKMVRIPYRNKTDYNNIVPILTKEII